ncbi:hypothetical protein [Shewanella aestuarii]|uniref:Uncharacterized protein n=1 Tax=Shewanella aestuarii TaxID=1028752 RepID=A0A6G9QS65_9GAMM|nr:hypothetical protein [Shewanella aestuarii]QIR16621.1 hypothetical protein HBH39_19285 [Shewanella aestuarii]
MPYHLAETNDAYNELKFGDIGRPYQINGLAMNDLRALCQQAYSFDELKSFFEEYVPFLLCEEYWNRSELRGVTVRWNIAMSRYLPAPIGFKIATIDVDRFAGGEDYIAQIISDVTPTLKELKHLERYWNALATEVKRFPNPERNEIRSIVYYLRQIHRIRCQILGI